MSVPVTKREWATPINSATMRKRSKLFVDGRLIIFPASCLVGGIFVPGTTSIYFILTGFVLYGLAKALFMRWPWLIDDIQAEMTFPYELADRAPRKDVRES